MFQGWYTWWYFLEFCTDTQVIGMFHLQIHEQNKPMVTYKLVCLLCKTQLSRLMANPTIWPGWSESSLSTHAIPFFFFFFMRWIICSNFRIISILNRLSVLNIMCNLFSAVTVSMVPLPRPNPPPTPRSELQKKGALFIRNMVSLV